MTGLLNFLQDLFLLQIPNAYLIATTIDIFGTYQRMRVAVSCYIDMDLRMSFGEAGEEG